MAERGIGRAVPIGLFLALAAPLIAADAPKKPGLFDPPFDIAVPTPHRVTMTVDTTLARGILALLTVPEDAPARLRELKESPLLPLAVKAEGITSEDYLGKLVAAAAGTPGPVLSSYISRAGYFRTVLDDMDEEGKAAAAIEGRRIASLFPPTPVTDARLVLVPFLGISGFADVIPVKEGDTLYLIADLPRVTGDAFALPTPHEAFLKVLRETSSEAWRALFSGSYRRPPAWSSEKLPDFDALLSRTIAEGPATLFLFPDEFFPLSSLLGEPIQRSFARWNHVVEALADPKRKESEKRDILEGSTRGEFWGRCAAIVGAQMTDALVRLAGRDAYLKALAGGPRAVAALYVSVSKGTKLPELGKPAKKALESAGPPGPNGS